MKILYLYSELMGYQIPILKEYISKYGAEVHVIHWDHKKLTPFIPPSLKNVFFHKRSEFNNQMLKEFVTKLSPDIAYVSGWMDKGYLKVTRELIKREIPVVSGFDDIWQSTLRQRIASLLFPLLKNKFFSYAWVAGPYQYEYVKRLGFKNDRIIHNCLTADIEIFNKAFTRSATEKKNNYPHRFLYVGRFENIKGVDLLIKAWRNIQDYRKDWDLFIIGNGSLKINSSEQDNLIVNDFMKAEQLVEEAQKSGCFVLPSRAEPWALVIHEFAAAGLPIICSDVCGAAPLFVIPKYNGFTFKANDPRALERSLLKIINTSDEDLYCMAEKSHYCGQRITPEIAAASFISILS